MSEWGDWIGHDGMGCPCKGQWVQIVARDGTMREHIAHSVIIHRDNSLSPALDGGVGRLDAWLWANRQPNGKDVLRYRIRRPRGMEILRRILANVERERVDS